MMNSTPETLTRLESERFADLWQACQAELFAYTLLRMRRDYWAACEIMSDLAAQLLKPEVFRKLGDDPHKYRFLPFAKRAIGFVIGWRFENCRRRRPAFQYGEEPLPSDLSASVVNDVLRNECRTAIRDALCLLTERERLVLSLDLKGERAEQIADVVGTSRRMVYHERQMALARLRRIVPTVLDPGGKAVAR